MAWMQFHGRSRSLGMEISFQALIPQYDENEYKGPKDKGPYKVIYLLHCLDGNSSSWMRMTALERRMKNEPVIVLMPETDNMWFVNTATGFKYFDELTREWPELLKNWFPVSDRREDTMIAGFSMGGYGALVAGLRCPDQYGFVGAYAPGTDLSIFYEMNKLTPKAQYIFGPKEEALKSENNPYLLLDRVKEGMKMPYTYLAVGKEDRNLPEVQHFAACVEKKGIPMKCEVLEGAHDWYFAEQAFYRSLDIFLGKGPKMIQGDN